MAYARAQAQQPEGDLYDVTGDGTCRDGWKKLINAMLFKTKPLGGWPTDTLEALPKGTKFKDAVAAIKRKHAPIAKLFEQGLGYQLMRRESDLLVSVVTALFKQGITALPLHDSVLVARSRHHDQDARGHGGSPYMLGGLGGWHGGGREGVGLEVSPRSHWAPSSCPAWRAPWRLDHMPCLMGPRGL
jgi:hypothetical protein